jgi:hypothetical protein
MLLGPTLSAVDNSYHRTSAPGSQCRFLVHSQNGKSGGDGYASHRRVRDDFSSGTMNFGMAVTVEMHNNWYGYANGIDRGEYSGE